MGACNLSVPSFRGLSKPSPSLSLRPAHHLPPVYICMQLGARDCGRLEFTSTYVWSDSETDLIRADHDRILSEMLENYEKLNLTEMQKYIDFNLNLIPGLTPWQRVKWG